MPKRTHHPAWIPFLLLALSGCGGGPSNKDICLAIVAVMPPTYVITLCILRVLEWFGRAPDRGTGSIRWRALATMGGIAVSSALVLKLGGLPEPESIKIALVAFGAVALGVSLIFWRARRKFPYTSRILYAAAIGLGPGLPALVLWHPRLGGLAVYYVLATMLSSMAAIVVTPLLLLGLAIEALTEPSGASTSTETGPDRTGGDDTHPGQGA